MHSEDCSIGENSSSHLEKGEQSNATSSYFATYHEGSIQVPIPCAVMNVVIIMILIIALISLSVGKYNCPDPLSDTPVSQCSNDWIQYQMKCYFISSMKDTWTMAQRFCSKHKATLVVIDSEEEMIFLKQYVDKMKYWIGLKNETSQTWKWSNSNEFSNWFNMTKPETCPFLNSTDVSSADCQKPLHWICNKPSSS
ncbi:PREDICTED: early activation antigen CD69-like [Elephantulus edwardii]|uniref:early activation antigen CD69-like n=1 Tax=Elephantulus edwardii TaxID=28737 RepID=UPI0003F0DFCF|nr:PREDICTED: early activation antigen CD69-like [Elephantulus edwardii]